MTIATWNVERLIPFRRLPDIESACASLHADILVLTETDTRIELPYRHCHYSSPLSKNEKEASYRPTERRVALYTNYECVRYHDTYDDKTAVCCELATPRGNLLVYGTIIGILGKQDSAYHEHLTYQLVDFRRLSGKGAGLCICGDFNCSFGDDYYFTAEERHRMEVTFSEIGVSILTKNQSECIDHIAISSHFVECSAPLIHEWNLDKSLSDHKGISVGFFDRARRWSKVTL